MTAKQQQLAKILTIFGVIIIVMVVMALIYNVVTIANSAVQVDALETRVTELSEIVANNEDLIAYRSSDEYIERYAREYLNMVLQFEVVFSGS